MAIFRVHNVMLSESSMLRCSHDTEQIMPFRKEPEQEVTWTNEPHSLLNLSSLLLLFLPFCLLHPFFSSVKANKDESFSGAWWEIIIRLPNASATFDWVQHDSNHLPIDLLMQQPPVSLRGFPHEFVTEGICSCLTTRALTWSIPGAERKRSDS